MRRTTKWMIGTLAIIVVVIVYPIVFAWSPLWCWNEDIGLDTGRMRSTTYLCWVCVSSHDEPTVLSDVLQIPQTTVETRWAAVNTFSPGVSYSPHYSFHCALAQISELETCWLRHHFSPEAKRLTAQALLDLWRSDEDYHAADKLLGPLKHYSYSHAMGNTISDEEVKRLLQNEG